MAVADLGKLLAILVVGMPATLFFTSQTAVMIRNAVKTENKELAKAKPNTPFLPSHYIAWGAVMAVALALTAYNPAGEPHSLSRSLC